MLPEKKLRANETRVFTIILQCQVILFFDKNTFIIIDRVTQGIEAGKGSNRFSLFHFKNVVFEDEDISFFLNNIP